MFKLVAFLTGGRVGETMLRSMTSSVEQSFSIVVANPSEEINNILKFSKNKIDLVHVVDAKPDWVKLMDQLGKSEPLRGLSWFPFIFPENIISMFSGGILNIHNSFLPYNRGRHSTFWAILEGTPFGASIHWVDSGIDSGNIVERMEVKGADYANADEMYELQLDACISLANKYIPRLQLEIPSGTSQNDIQATHHFRRDILEATTFNSESPVTWENVVKLLRATSASKGYVTIVFPGNVHVRLSGKVV